MEAIVLAGGKAERMGDATGGRPKSLVDVAGKPLVAYQIGRLANAGVGRVIVSCAAGQGEVFRDELGGLEVEIVCAEEPERLGRGGGIKFAARERSESGDVFAMNGDELVDVGFEALLGRHRETGAAATVSVARPASPFGVVELGDDDVVTGFSEGGRIPVLGQLRRLRPLPGGDRALPRTGRPRVDRVPGAGRRGAAPGLPTRGPVADGEHAEGAAPRPGARHGPPRVVGVMVARMCERAGQAAP